MEEKEERYNQFYTDLTFPWCFLRNMVIDFILILCLKTSD